MHNNVLYRCPKFSQQPVKSFWAASPPTFLGRLRRSLGQQTCEAELRFLLLFLEKKSSARRIVFGGKPPKPLGRLRRGLGQQTYCEAEQRFLLLFLEKEEYWSTNSKCVRVFEYI
jgi:hypothetical protein